MGEPLIVKLDPKGRVKLPRDIYKQYPPGQKFKVEKSDGKIILIPIKKITVELEDGTVIETSI